MARVNKQILGVINGKIGNFVFRNVNGKTFVSNRPLKYNVNGTEESTRVKKGFKNLIQFSSYINSIPILKEVWRSKSVKGKRAYNKIFSHNKSHVKSSEISEYLFIVPTVSSVQMSVYKVDIEQNYTYVDYKTNYKVKDCIYNYVLVFYSKQKKRFIHQAGILDNMKPKKRMLLNIKLGKDVVKFISTRGRIIAYFAVVVQDQSGCVKTWSNTASEVYK